MDRKNLYAYAGVNDHPRQRIMIIPLSEVALIETSTAPDLCPSDHPSKRTKGAQFCGSLMLESVCARYQSLVCAGLLFFR